MADPILVAVCPPPLSRLFRFFSYLRPVLAGLFCDSLNRVGSVAIRGNPPFIKGWLCERGRGGLFSLVLSFVARLRIGWAKGGLFRFVSNFRFIEKEGPRILVRQ